MSWAADLALGQAHRSWWPAEFNSSVARNNRYFHCNNWCTHSGQRKFQRFCCLAPKPGQFGVQRRALPLAAAFFRFGLARGIDEHTARKLRGESEEVRAVFER